MKKIILIFSLLFVFAGCEQFNPDEIIRKAGDPFKEYKVPDEKLAENIEKGILESESESKGLDLTETTSHLISLTKIGTYGKGEVRILGNLTEEKLKEVQKKNPKRNGIVSYSCYFEYSFKNGMYSWRSDYTE